MGEAGADVVGVDWRVPLHDAARRTGGRVALQGNLDPAVLFAAAATVEAEALRIVAEGRAAPGHVFNLGHGVLPENGPGRPHPRSSSWCTAWSRELSAGRGRRWWDLGSDRRAPAPDAARTRPPRSSSSSSATAWAVCCEPWISRECPTTSARRRSSAAARAARAARRAGAGRRGGAPGRCGGLRAGRWRHGPAADRHAAGGADERRPARRCPVLGRNGGGEGRTRPADRLGDRGRCRARRVAAGALRRRAGRPAGRPVARRRLRRPGGRARTAGDGAHARRGPGCGRALGDRGRRPGHRRTSRESCVCARRVARSCTAARVRGPPRRLAVLVDALATGVDVRLSTTVRALNRLADGWRLVLGPDQGVLDVDAVVLAVPAPAAARLLAEVVPTAATAAAEIQLRRPSSSRWPTGSATRRGCRRRPACWSRPVEPLSIKAATHSSRKWPHLTRRRPTGWCGCAPRWAGSARRRRCRSTTPSWSPAPAPTSRDAGRDHRGAGRRARAAVGRRPAAVRGRPRRPGSARSTSGRRRAGPGGRRGGVARRRGPGVRRDGARPRRSGWRSSWWRRPR